MTLEPRQSSRDPTDSDIHARCVQSAASSNEFHVMSVMVFLWSMFSWIITNRMRKACLLVPL